MITLNRLSLALPVAAVAASLVFVPALSAQQAAPPKPAEAHAHHAAPKQEEDHAKSGWKELDAFHDVMSAAWHPAKKDSLAPARAASARLVAAAKSWAAASAPKGCDSPAVKAAIAKLVPESEAAARLVASNADDAALKAALKTVHDTFHVAEEGCKPDKHAGHGAGR